MAAIFARQLRDKRDGHKKAEIAEVMANVGKKKEERS